MNTSKTTSKVPVKDLKSALSPTQINYAFDKQRWHDYDVRPELALRDLSPKSFRVSGTFHSPWTLLCLVGYQS